MKRQYDYNSEIINLPGTYKRDIKDIHDDIFTIYKKKKGTAFGIKNQQLYQSKIKCLNGKGIDGNIPNMKKKILSINTDNINTNNYIYSNRKNHNYLTSVSQKDFGNYNTCNNGVSGNYKKQNLPFKNEIFRVIHQQPLKTKYKYNYKNLSQITIG